LTSLPLYQTLKISEAFEYQQTLPFFALFMATLRADPPGWRRRRAAPAGRLDRSALLGGPRSELEDAHWADNGTLLALRSLASPVQEVPVLWVLTRNSTAGRNVWLIAKSPMPQSFLSITLMRHA